MLEIVIYMMIYKEKSSKSNTLCITLIPLYLEVFRKIKIEKLIKKTNYNILDKYLSIKMKIIV